MRTYILRQLIRLIAVVFGVSIITFALVHLSGDPAVLMLPQEATQEEIADFRHKMGFDRPLLVQYGDFLRGALAGDLGVSLKHQRPTIDVVNERLPATVELSVAAFAVSVAIAVPAGIFAAVRRRSVLDGLLTGVAMLGQSMPVFWVGILLIMLFAVNLGWFPVSGWGTLEQLVLPAVTLGVWTAPVLVRLVRSSMLEVLSQDYVRTARAKGLSERVVVYKHALRNAGIPIVTMLGIQFGRLLGGAVITESVFAIPGVGRLTVQGIFSHDFPLVQGTVIYLSTVIVLLNFAVDVLYAYINPQIRFQ